MAIMSAFISIAFCALPVQAIALAENSTGSCGTMEPLSIDQSAPRITADIDSATPFLFVTQFGPSYVSGVVNDPTDPATVKGIPFLLADNDTPLSDLTVSAVSDNQNVIPDANLALTGSGGSRTLTIRPAGIGYANIILTVSDPEANTGTYQIHYAGSRQANNPATTYFHTGASDGSTAIIVDSTYMWVGDDENQILRLYDRWHSGYPVNAVDMSPNIGTIEADIEASYKQGDTLFWIGSHTTTERSVAFSVIASGTGSASTLNFLNKYTDLRADLIAWDENNVHGLGAGFYGLSTGLEIEGLAMEPGHPDGALLALRGPLTMGDAILIPVTNFRTIVSTDVPPHSAVFGTPIQVNLGGHGFRSMECNAYGCMLIAGPVGSGTDFSLYTWSGIPADAPELRAVRLMSGTLGDYEGIEGLSDHPFLGSAGDNIITQLILDMGSFKPYGDGIEAKDLSINEWQKFASETITLGPVESLTTATAGDIVITEVMQNPAAVTDALGEWFEVFNTTFSPIDLNGWIIADMDIDIDTIDNGGPLEVPAGGYMILGINADAATNGGITVAYAYNNIFLGNGADELILRTPDGTVIDSIAWDGGTLWPDPTGASMSLQDPGLDNNDGTNWCVATTPYGAGDLGTPGTTNDCPPPGAADLQITEAWVGQTSGPNLTADWFEITNFGDASWTSGVDPDLFYDDDSEDPAAADPINGITEILPGKSVVVVVGTETDVTTFRDIWSPDYKLDDVEVGWTDGAGLGQGGDGVTLFLGGPSAGTITDFESFGAVPSGVSWDVVLQAFSQAGVGIPQIGSNVAVATTATNGSEPAVGSPGNEGPVINQPFTLKITEIFSGQAGTDLTADWFEIHNEGAEAWVSGTDPDLFYDDDSQDPNSATPIEGISEIPAGKYAIVLVGTAADIPTFMDVWSPVIDLTGVPVGSTDGAGLGGGGDLVTLWAGDPMTSSPVDTAGYPDTQADDGKSYDVSLGAFSEIGNANGAVQTIALGGSNGDVPNIGSPGNQGPVATKDLRDYSEEVVVYPNPGNGRYVLDLSKVSGVQNLRVYNITGQLMISQPSTSETRMTLDLRNFNDGVYILRMEMEKGVATVRLVKE